MDVLKNLPFDVGTTIDSQGVVSTKLRLYDPSRGVETILAYDRDHTVALIEQLRVALAVVEGSNPSN